jgi:geranylgeranyl pyrophosphate synthase
MGARKAVLLGDIIFATAIRMMSDLSREDGQVVSQTIAKVSRGAFLETLDPSSLIREIESRVVSSKLYEKIIHLKTGILFGAACRLGAISAGVDDFLKEKSYLYGSRIGEAYQIADDLKDVEQHLKTRSISPDRMAALAPLFLHFAQEMKPHILAILAGNGSQLKGEALDYLSETLILMKGDIEHRLKSAISVIEADLPNNQYRNLIRTTPSDLIGMLLES